MTSINGAQNARWPRARSRMVNDHFTVWTYRSGPLQILRLRFAGDAADAVQDLHVGRVAIGRGGDGVTEGFVDGVKAKWLKSSYPQIIVSWWPPRDVVERLARAQWGGGDRG